MEQFSKRFDALPATEDFCRSVYPGLDLRIAQDPAVLWTNKYFGFRILSVRELHTAIPYLFLLDGMFPGRVSLRSVVTLNPRGQRDIVRNWDHLRSIWTEMKIQEMLVLRVDLKSLETMPDPESHLQLLQALVRLYDASQKLRGSLHKPLPDYDPFERRRGMRTATWIATIGNADPTPTEVSERTACVLANLQTEQRADAMGQSREHLDAGTKRSSRLTMSYLEKPDTRSGYRRGQGLRSSMLHPTQKKKDTPESAGTKFHRRVMGY